MEAISEKKTDLVNHYMNIAYKLQNNAKKASSLHRMNQYILLSNQRRGRIIN